MKKLMIFTACWLLALQLTHAHPNHGKTGEKSYVEQLVEAKQKGWTLPLLSTQGTFGDSFGYMMQQGMVNYIKLEDPIIGYKAGLTSEKGQAKFKVNGPLMGALFASGKLDASKPIQSKNYHKLMLETEIGFVLKQDITEQVTVENVLSLIESVAPVIELPNLAYANLAQVTGLDLIATNVASNAVLVGTPVSQINTLDLNAISTQLQRNGKTIIQGKGSDASGDQLQALAWLVNRILNQGYALQKGHLLITGALGPMVPAQPGKYSAKFGPLGAIDFIVE